jgi:hypothetical protein
MDLSTPIDQILTAENNGAPNTDRSQSSTEDFETSKDTILPKKPFADLCDVLHAGFKNGLTEDDYFLLIQLLRSYANDPDSKEEEERVCAVHGWPKDYNPCDFMERLRFAFWFTSTPTLTSELLGKMMKSTTPNDPLSRSP